MIPTSGRIIPTYVGSTKTDIEGNSQRPNHSHVCGINFVTFVSRFGSFESFPRMWDQRKARWCNGHYKRIIPTYVGSTMGGAYSLQGYTNHSHVCGINRVNALLRTGKDESFPRMWDQPLSLVFLLSFTRIIPTYVGSTDNSHRS